MAEITKIPPPFHSPEPKGENDLNKTQRDNCAQIAYLMDTPSNTFRWSHTAEGEDFLGGVRDRLYAISEGEPLK